MSDRLEPVREWLRSRMADPALLHDSYDLMAAQVLDSLTFVEYIVLLEEHLGVEIPVEDGLLEKVRTLENVREHFA